MNKIERLEGTIVWVNLTGKVEKQGLDGKEPRPYIRFIIKDDSGKEKSFELPVDIPNTPFGAKELENKVRYERVVCITEEPNAYGRNFGVKRISFQGSKFRGFEFGQVEY
jgi:hypothetical protein